MRTVKSVKEMKRTLLFIAIAYAILFVIALRLSHADDAASPLTWGPSPNAVQCLVCTTATSDPGGEFLACQLVDQDTDEGRLGYCDHYSDDGHYAGTPGTVDGVRQPPTSSYSTTIVIHPIPGWNFSCVGWTDRPADGSAGHEGVFECFPFEVAQPAAATRRHRRSK